MKKFIAILLATLTLAMGIAVTTSVSAETDMAEALVVHYDFSGKTIEEALQDKATGGQTKDNLICYPSGNKLVGSAFTGTPVDANSVASEARCAEWLSAYGDFMLETFDFDGAIGTMANYVYNHKYIFDSAYHVNDYGRTYRTYDLYLDILPQAVPTLVRIPLNAVTVFVVCYGLVRLLSMSKLTRRLVA